MYWRKRKINLTVKKYVNVEKNNAFKGFIHLSIENMPTLNI